MICFTRLSFSIYVSTNGTLQTTGGLSLCSAGVYICVCEVFLSFFLVVGLSISLSLSRLLFLAKTSEVNAERCMLEPSKREKRSPSLSLSRFQDSPSSVRSLLS